MDDQIKQFFTSRAFGVIGASTKRDKYGNKVLRCYMQYHKKVYPVNPRADIIEGIHCIDQVANLPNEVKSLSVITPPQITEDIVDQAIIKGIKHIWMQPGAESELAIQKCKQHGMNVIAGGPCILVVLGFQDI